MMFKKEYGKMEAEGRVLDFTDETVELQHRMGWVRALTVESQRKVSKYKDQVRSVFGKLIEATTHLTGDYDGNVDTSELQLQMNYAMIDIVECLDDLNNQFSKMDEAVNTMRLELKKLKEIEEIKEES